MAILSEADYIAAAKQRVRLTKTSLRTTIAAQPFSVFDLAGLQSGGVLAGSSVAAGVVPTDTTPGCPLISAFGGGAAGYLSRFGARSPVASTIVLYDLLWKGGAYPFNAAQALTGQPSYASRLPGGNYGVGDLELWVEQVTAATGNQTVNVTYTDNGGTPGSSTGAVGISAAPTVGRMWQLPFAAGDSGIQKVDNVVGGVASVGTFNVLVLRYLAEIRIRSANDGDTFDYIRTGLPELFADSALFAMVYADSTSSGAFSLSVEIANK